MLDIELIQKDKPQLRQILLYEYSTAVFKARVYQRVRDHLMQKGIQVRNIDYENVMFSFNETSLFGEFLVLIDIDELRKDKKFKEYMTDMADLIAGKATSNRYLFFLRKNSPRYEAIKKMPQTTVISKAATKINEPALSKQTFLKLFEYACSLYTEFINLEKLENYQMFKTSVEDYVINEKPNLAEFLSKFDIFVFVTIDFETNQFNPTLFRTMISTQEKINFFKTHKLIFDFLTTPLESTGIKLYKEIDDMIHKRSLPVKVIISTLFKITRELSYVNAKLNPGKHTPESMTPYRWKQLTAYESVPLKNLLRWQILLAKYESSFNTKNLAIIFQQFLEEFK